MVLGSNRQFKKKKKKKFEVRNVGPARGLYEIFRILKCRPTKRALRDFSEFSNRVIIKSAQAAGPGVMLDSDSGSRRNAGFR